MKELIFTVPSLSFHSRINVKNELEVKFVSTNKYGKSDTETLVIPLPKPDHGWSIVFHRKDKLIIHDF